MRDDAPASEALKVLHVATRHRLGGAERNLVHTVDWELRQGHVVHVAIGGGSTVVDFPRDAVVHRIEPLSRAIRPSDDARALFELRRLTDAHRFDVVHSHQSKAGILARLAARGRARAIAHTIHMPSFGPGYGAVTSAAFLRAERLFARFTDLYAAVGAELADLYANARVGPRDRFHIVRSPIDIGEFAAARAAEGAADDESRAVAVGSLEPRKRFDLVIRCLADQLRRGDLSLAVAGDGPERKRLEALTHELGVDQRVRFLGYVEQPAQLIASAHVLVHASRMEGVPQVVIQALAAGTPVVATDAEGLREIAGAPIAIVDREGRGLAAAVALALASPPPPIDLAALDPWRVEQVEDQLAAFDAHLRAVVEAGSRSRGTKHVSSRSRRE